MNRSIAVLLGVEVLDNKDVDLNPGCAHFCHITFGSQYLHLYNGENDTPLVRIKWDRKTYGVLRTMAGTWERSIDSNPYHVLVCFYHFFLLEARYKYKGKYKKEYTLKCQIRIHSRIQIRIQEVKKINNLFPERSLECSFLIRCMLLLCADWELTQPYPMSKLTWLWHHWCELALPSHQQEKPSQNWNGDYNPVPSSLMSYVECCPAGWVSCETGVLQGGKRLRFSSWVRLSSWKAKAPSIA